MVCNIYSQVKAATPYLSYVFKKYYRITLGFHRNLGTDKPRVRFAPSPTGFLHLGGLRTALYNYLFAKSRKGTFILRIEDTDQTRIIDGSLKGLIRDLEWVGIEYQEGPGRGGDHGPYIQSERLHLYQEHLKTLLENGAAYYCFCSERRLNMLRREALKSHQKPRYDNKCRSLSNREVQEKMSAGNQSCVRFKLTSDCQSFEDIIFSGIAYDVSLNEGDPVIMKADGYPTYHFANVVDDHLMGITHVLRGVEWQISTTKHLLLYRAFGWEPPKFGHLPLIVNTDGTKLSKRQRDVKVQDYREKGIFPLSLVNYITLSGGGFDHVSGSGVRLRTMEDLAQEFQLDKVSCHPSRLNLDLLNECNRLEIKRQLKDKNKSKELVKIVQELVNYKFPNKKIQSTENHIIEVLSWATSRITRLEDLLSPELAFLWILPSKGELDLNQKELLGKLVSEIQGLEEFKESQVKVFLKEFSDANQVKFSDLMQTLRGLLSGLRDGPSVAEMMQLLGKEQTLDRLRTVLHVREV